MNFTEKAEEFVSKLSEKEKEAVLQAWKLSQETNVESAYMKALDKCFNMGTIALLINKSHEEEQ